MELSAKTTLQSIRAKMELRTNGTLELRVYYEKTKWNLGPSHWQHTSKPAKYSFDHVSRRVSKFCNNFLGAVPTDLWTRISQKLVDETKWNRGRHCNLFAQKWNFEQMELWAEFLNTKTQNGIPFVRERTVGLPGSAPPPSKPSGMPVVYAPNSVLPGTVPGTVHP